MGNLIPPVVFALFCWVNFAIPTMVTCVAAPVHSGERDDVTVPVWVFFRDKGVKDESAVLAQLALTYNKRAIERRSLRRGSSAIFDSRDLPVWESYVIQIAERSSRVRVRSRWLNAVSAEVTPDQLQAIRQLPFVKSVQPVRRGHSIRPLEPQPVEQGPLPLNSADFYGLAFDQLQTINLPPVHSAGLTGEGIIIGILDTGFKRTHTAFAHPDKPLQVLAEYDFINDDSQTGPESGDDPSQHVHGTIILGTLAAYLPNTYVGAAYDASFILCKTEDITDEYAGEEDFYVAGLEFIESHGGDLATSSLTYLDWYTQGDMDGITAVTSIAVNAATENGLYCCTAVGNSGHDQNPFTSRLGAPADAFKVFSVGSVNIAGVESGFSSDGPTIDGRTKPEVLAVGESAISISPHDDQGYVSASGTSLSTPMMAGAVACLAQSNPAISVSGMREAFMYTASDYLLNGTPDPLNVRGYGIIDAFAALAVAQQAIASIDEIMFITGSNISGGIPDILDSDDTYFRTRSGLGRSLLDRYQMQLEIRLSTTLSDAESLDLLLESRLSSPSGNQQIRLFNYDSNDWDVVGQRTVKNFDTSHRITEIPASSHISPDGSIRLRIKHTVMSRTISSSFESFFDQVQIETHR